MKKFSIPVKFKKNTKSIKPAKPAKNVKLTKTFKNVNLLKNIKLPTGTKQKSIRTTLFTGFLFPVGMILVLGISSYLTAAQTLKAKYEQTSMGTVSAVGLYADTLTSAIASRALEQVGSTDMKQYFEAYVTGDEGNSEEVRFNHYLLAKEQH